MGFWNKITRRKQQQTELVKHPVMKNAAGQIINVASSYGSYGWSGNPVFPMPFDGEINTGEAGPIYQYFLDYQRLRLRSRQLYIESEIAKAAIDTNTKWTIGAGLILKCEPKASVLKQSGIDVDTETFNNAVESLWSAYCDSKEADITGRRTLNELTSAAHFEVNVAGDVLVVLSVEKNTVKVKHIDGINVVTPATFSFNGVDYTAPNGNRVRNGVELDANGCHVAYYVRKDLTGFDCARIAAYGRRSGMLMAYLVVEKRYTEDSERGMPLMMACIEATKKLQRYVSAALAGAESRQKIDYFFEHEEFSNNEDPMAARRAKVSAGRGDLVADVAYDAEGNKKAAETTATTNHTTINLPNGVKVKSLDSKQEVEVDEFGNFNIDVIAAAVTIPPDVIMSKYNGSFSSSRMSGKDWEHTFLIRRRTFAGNYLDPIKSLQVYLWILANKLSAPGYLAALRSGDTMIINAYQHCRWAGDKFPDIDPLKTVKFLREALGPALAHIPIMTPEAAAELIDQGEVGAIIRQAQKDLEEAKKAGINPEQINTVKPQNDNSIDLPAKEED